MPCISPENDKIFYDRLINFVIAICVAAGFIFLFISSPNASEFIIKLKKCYRPAIELFPVLLEVALVYIGFKGLHMWREQLWGTNKHKALMNIRKKSIKFNRVYQSLRLLHINRNIQYQGYEPSKDNTIEAFTQELYSKNIYNEHLKRLWGFYDELTSSIDAYKIHTAFESDFLDPEINTILFYLQAYELSVKKYCTSQPDSLSSQNKTNCEAYLLKSPNDDDPVSMAIKKEVKNIFEKTQAHLDS